ncbi:MAG: VTT domain-containing protein [Chloroflexi bacterium]|nr:VTT domain-containing protein [Chloroflexota bacterium]
MTEAAKSAPEAGAGTQGKVRKRLSSFLMLIAVTGISIGLFLFSQRNPEEVRALSGLGYLGIFLISLISSATVILPVPGALVAFSLALTLNPVLVALAASTGGIIGEITGYMAGYGGHGMLHHGPMHDRAKRWIKRWGIWTIFFFATVPLMPFDLAGLFAGALRYPLWKFLVVGWVGKSIKFIALVFAMKAGWEALLRLFS